MTRLSNIDVLDKGYVRLVDVMGSDLSVVNAARASFLKESVEFSERDERLLKFLIREGHWSPFRHATATFEVKAPLMVRSQWFKYHVGHEHTPMNFIPYEVEGFGNGDDGSNDPLYARNEASRRYVTMEPEFYIPGDMGWRKAPENKKQGSGGFFEPEIGEEYMDALQGIVFNCLQEYNAALEEGVAPEQARLFLPAYAMYTVWRWTASLEGILHFLKQRLADDAQYEIREYAKAVKELVEPKFPVTVKAFLEYQD